MQPLTVLVIVRVYVPAPSTTGVAPFVPETKLPPVVVQVNVVSPPKPEPVASSITVGFRQVSIPGAAICTVGSVSSSKTMVEAVAWQPFGPTTVSW